MVSVDLNGKIVVQDLNGKLISGYLSDEEIFDITFFNNYLLFITRNKCYIADFKSNKIVHETTLNGFLRKCLVLDDKILVSNNKGTIYQLDENLRLLNAIKFGYSPISQMKLNANEELLAISSSEKKIGIFRANNLDGEHLIIDNIDSQIRSLEFSESNFLIVSLENGECRFWSTNVNNNILELCKISSRSLSKTEWNKHIGNKIIYKEACKN
jgi:WD40 repeat protein